jgi:hypothetical protein
MVVDFERQCLEELRGYARALEFEFPLHEKVNNLLADPLNAQGTTGTYIRP